MSLTNYAAQALLNSLFGKSSNFGALASAPTIYVGLSSTAPAEDGTNITEPSGGAYDRVQTPASDWNSATDADPSVLDNANPISFPKATADWLSGSNLTHFFLADAATGGNILAFGSLNTSKPVLTDDTAEFGAGELSTTMD
jgi:uncharacterized membrane protein